MSEKQKKKITKTHYYFDTPGIPFTDCCNVAVINGDKTCRSCGATLILDITADQREKVIRLCEKIEQVSPDWNQYKDLYVCQFCYEAISFKKIDHLGPPITEQIKHKQDCIYNLAKKLLEELQ